MNWQNWVINRFCGQACYRCAQALGRFWIENRLAKNWPVCFVSGLNQVKLWIIENQEGRRNLTDAWKYRLAQTSKDILLEMGEAAYTRKAVFKGNQHTAPLSIIDNGPKHNTQKIIAADLGWSTGKVAMLDRVSLIRVSLPVLGQTLPAQRRRMTQLAFPVTLLKV